jgi:ADP-heptose:LPS heptosyltransferase
METINWMSTVKIRDAKNICLYRPGGIGDLLFIIPYLSSIKKENPNCKITFITTVENASVLNISNCIDNIITEPTEYSMILRENFDYFELFDNFIEKNPRAEILSAMDLCEERFDGIERGPLETKFHRNIKKLLDRRRKNEKFHIGIGYKSSSRIRDISPAIWFSYLKDLSAEKYRVSLVIPPEHQADGDELLKRMETHNSKLEVKVITRKNIMHVVSYVLEEDPLDIGIAPDSGLSNIWGYHEIPVIGIFGPFDSKLRLKYYKCAIGVDMITDCAYGRNEFGSCFEHGTGSCHLARYRSEVFSPCIHLLDSDVLLIATEFLLREVYDPPKKDED